MPAANMDEFTVEELESLMKEFPEWKEQFPDMYREVCPQRYSKLNGKKDKISGDRVMAKKQVASFESDYQSRFPKHREYRPRSSKKPPPSPTPEQREPRPMTFGTNQRADFVPKDLGVRAELIKAEQEYDIPQGKLDGTTHYKQDFKGHYDLSNSRSRRFDPFDKMHKDDGAKFDSKTTSKEHFKPWKSCPSKPFAELPCFTGTVIYPESGHDLETTNGTTFCGAPGKKSEQFILQENLRLEGDMDLNTTHKSSFHGFDDARPAQRVRNMPDTMVKQRGQFSGKSQSMKDFPEYTRGQPRPAKLVEPAPATIDLKFDNKQMFTTEQRGQFPGIDTRLHPTAKLCRKEDLSYKPPSVKFETSTSQKMDFEPLSAEPVQRSRVRPSSFYKSEEQPKFDDRTAHKDSFKKWETPSRVRQGDLHEGHKYVPPANKFDSRTTNQDVYLGKCGPIQDSFKPEDKPVNEGGNHDFNTMYSVTFEQPKLAKCLDKQQAERLLAELRKKKSVRSHAAPRAVVAI